MPFGHMFKFLPVVALVGVAACAPAPHSGGRGTPVEGGELNAYRDGERAFGSAGSAWSDAEIRNDVYGAICGPEQRPVDVVIDRAEDGSAKFTARCA